MNGALFLADPDTRISQQIALLLYAYDQTSPFHRRQR